MKEIYQRHQKDEHNIIGAEIIDIAKSELDGRKVVIFKRKDGTEFHLESPKGTKLTISQQFKYISPKTTERKKRS